MNDLFKNLPPTEKIYETEGMTLEFNANVLACVPCNNGLYAIVLDRTAFFPGGGGQEFDTGFIGGSSITKAEQIGDVIVHYSETPAVVGNAVCSVDRAERIRRMEHHTGEHVFSGTVHKHFGLENTGFHLGTEYVTIDTSGPLSAEQLAEAERLANEAVRKNDRIEILFPSDEELSRLEYRSKKELTGQVRIVKIGETDTCACCAPHLERTGQVGAITIISAMPYKGGMRLFMLAGDEAIRELRRRQNALKAAGEMLSVKPNEVPEAVKKLRASFEEAGRERAALISEICEMKLSEQRKREDYRLLVYEKADAQIANRLGKEQAKGVLFFLAVFGQEGALRYVMKSDALDLGKLAPQVNGILGGRGGGKSGEISGSVGVPLKDVEECAAKIYEKLKREPAPALKL